MVVVHKKTKESPYKKLFIWKIATVCGGYLLRKLPATNFFFLYFLAHNVEYGVLKEVLHCLALMVNTVQLASKSI
jgi:hypothetical protein